MTGLALRTSWLDGDSIALRYVVYMGTHDDLFEVRFDLPFGEIVRSANLRMECRGHERVSHGDLESTCGKQPSTQLAQAFYSIPNRLIWSRAASLARKNLAARMASSCWSGLATSHTLSTDRPQIGKEYAMTLNAQRVLFVTSHHLFRECLVNGLAARAPKLAVDTADTVTQGYALCVNQEYTLALFDADPPDPFSPAMTRKFRQKHKDTEVVIVGRCRSEDEVIAFLEAGASDFRITDSESLDDFCVAMQSALRGEINHQPERTRALFARLQKLSAEVSRIKTIDTMVLTDREMEILRLLDEGQSNKQIAKALHISLHTVKNHVHRILEKLQVCNRREAVHLAYNNGWLKVEAN